MRIHFHDVAKDNLRQTAIRDTQERTEYLRQPPNEGVEIISGPRGTFIHYMTSPTEYVTDIVGGPPRWG